MKVIKKLIIIFIAVSVLFSAFTAFNAADTGQTEDDDKTKITQEVVVGIDLTNSLSKQDLQYCNRAGNLILSYLPDDAIFGGFYFANYYRDQDDNNYWNISFSETEALPKGPKNSDTGDEYKENFKPVKDYTEDDLFNWSEFVDPNEPWCYTNLEKAMYKGLSKWKESTGSYKEADPSCRRTIVLITDGKIDIGDEKHKDMTKIDTKLGNLTQEEFAKKEIVNHAREASNHGINVLFVHVGENWEINKNDLKEYLTVDGKEPRILDGNESNLTYNGHMIVYKPPSDLSDFFFNYFKNFDKDAFQYEIYEDNTEFKVEIPKIAPSNLRFVLSGQDLLNEEKMTPPTITLNEQELPIKDNWIISTNNFSFIKIPDEFVKPGKCKILSSTICSSIVVTYNSIIPHMKTEKFKSSISPKYKKVAGEPLKISFFTDIYIW